MNVVTVVGARPQFIKAAPVSRALAARSIGEVLVHTGQHYDPSVSQVFFDELDLPRPAVNLEVGSGTHATQTGAMLERLERVLLERAPAPVLVYGDTNSTIAAALAAAKLDRPVLHVEAGLRSFNRRMPEEVNRVVTDRLSALLFCPTPTAVENLAAEGITEGVHLVGDVMQDATHHFAGRARAQAPLDGLTPHPPGGYYLATLHRASNTDDPAVLAALMAGLGRLDRPVVLPLHPRTKARLEAGRIAVPERVALRPPVGYLAMLTLVSHARAVLTDSGGLQKEAFWLGVPCVTMRTETEWVETLAGGWNRLVGADPEALVAAIGRLPAGRPPVPEGWPQLGASDRIAAILEAAF